VYKIVPVPAKSFKTAVKGSGGQRNSFCWAREGGTSLAGVFITVLNQEREPGDEVPRFRPTTRGDLRKSTGLHPSTSVEIAPHCKEIRSEGNRVVWEFITGSRGGGNTKVIKR